MYECRKVQPFVDAFVDGELSAERVLEVEQHLSECNDCLEHVQLTRAFQNSTRQAVHNDCPLTLAFQHRVCEALKAERERALYRSRVHHPIAERPARQRPLPWRTVVPVAAAAALALVFANTKNTRSDSSTSSASSSSFTA